MGRFLRTTEYGSRYLESLTAKRKISSGSAAHSSGGAGMNERISIIWSVE